MAPSPNGISSDMEAINMMTALKTAFSHSGDPEMYLAKAADSIRQVEKQIGDICKRNRGHMEDNLYNLLESRDQISERRQELDQSTTTASTSTQQVAKVISKLNEKMTIRNNLDAALTVAGQTRKLTRMYARIADTIDARRLYPAFRMLKLLEEETRCITPGSVLQELVPDCQRLRAKITMHNRKAFHSWLSTVRKFEQNLGSYVLHYEHDQVSVRQQQPLPGDETVAVIQGGMTTQQGSTSLNASKFATRRPWTPLLTISPSPPIQGKGQQHVGIGNGNLNGIRHRVPSLTSINGPRYNIQSEQPNGGNNGVGTGGMIENNEAPKLFLRTLLQCILVNDGLGLLADMRSDYRRERYGHLIRLLETADTSEEVSRMEQMEIVIMKVVGFFVVERTVEKHASVQLIPRPIVDTEWWPFAHARLQARCKEMERECERGNEGDGKEKQKIRLLQTMIEQFAKVHALVV